MLLRAGRPDGAVYLAGYGLECILKWAATRRRIGVYLEADLETHDLDRLLWAAELHISMQREPHLRAIYTRFADLWSPELRYKSAAFQISEAESLYQHVLTLYAWVEERAL